MVDMLDEPLEPRAARALVREILRSGRFTYSNHAKEEMLSDDLTTVDCENVLRAGVPQRGRGGGVKDLWNEQWRLGS